MFNNFFTKNNNKLNIKKSDSIELYNFAKRVYLMGDTIKKRNKNLWEHSKKIVYKIEPNIIKNGK